MAQQNTALTFAPQSEPLQVLTFDLGGETFALEAGMVREVIDLTAETLVPGAPAFVSAVINFRGRVIPLSDLRPVFQLEARGPTIDSRIVVIEYELDGDPTLIGLRADKVYEVTSIDPADTEAPPRVGLKWRPELIRCLARRDGDLIVVPDFHQIFQTGGAASAPVIPLNSRQA